jgi:hypothetical protein
MNQPATTDAASSSVDPERTVGMPSRPDIGEPREWNIVGRYLPDPSLRYTKVRVGGASLYRFMILSLLSAVAVAAVGIPSWRLGVHHSLTLSSLAALPGVLACLLLGRPLLTATGETYTRLFFWRTLRAIGLGLDRAVFQPGTTFRYEVHLPSARQVDLHEVKVRLVFWESWHERVSIPWTDFRRWVVRKQGHDLIAQTAMALQLARGQHGVVRGEIRVPTHRPTEHHRGKPKHLSYVNLTVTIVATDKRRTPLFVGDCPHLITFPWM